MNYIHFMRRSSIGYKLFSQVNKKCQVDNIVGKYWVIPTTNHRIKGEISALAQVATILRGTR